MRLSKALATAILLMVMSPLLAQAENVKRPQDSADGMAVSPTRVDWAPTDDAERWVLTLTGPGDFYLRSEFAAGQAPFLSLSDLKGEIPDGSYTYELRGIPRQGARLPERPLVRSGHLAVQNGAFVSPTSKAGVESRPLPPSEPEMRSATAATQTIPEPLVVVGGACIGVECEEEDVTDGLTLKSFLPDLYFDDTTDGISPVHDWAISINGFIGLGEFFAVSDIDAFTVPFKIEGDSPDSALYVRNNGNLGLGTSTPAQDVHLMSGNSPTFRLEQNGSGGLTARTWELGSNDANFFVRDVTGGSVLPFRIRSGAPASSLDIASDGKVGLGTSSPLARLHVNAGEVRFPAGAGAFGNTHFNLSTDGRNYIRGTTVIADNGGSVGIGVTNPLAPFHVGAGEVRLPPAPDGFGNTHFNHSSGKNYIRGTTIISDNGGSVGVGTSSPLSKLHVNGGDIRVQGGSFIDDGTTLNAPDYVFEPDYRLMSLGELREFVAREKHLPNVPSAADIKDQGLNLSQFQMRLLEKIEELALYTLTQDEQIRAQQTHITELQAAKAALDTRLAAVEQAAAPAVDR